MSSSSNVGVLVVDLQTYYYQGPIKKNFPNLENNVSKVLKWAREKKFHIFHVRQQDIPEVSPWLPWWRELHPADFGVSLGEPTPLESSKELEGEPVFIKHDYDGFSNKDLNKTISERGVKTLIIFGIVTRACMLNTAMSAFNKGYRIYMVADCCGDRDIKVHNQVMETYNGYSCRVLTSDQIINTEF